MKKWIKRILWSLAFVIIGVAVGCWFILPKLVLSPYRMVVEQRADLFPQGITPAEYNLQSEDFDFKTPEGYNIDAWFIPANDSAKCTLIILHGIGACKESFLPATQFFTENHCNVVLFDLRAHGKSEGPYCTYGFFEKDDIKILTDKILERSIAPIGIYGTSLGGAMAYQVLAQDQRISIGIIESTFDGLDNVVREYTKRFIGFRCNWLADFALWRAGHVGDFDPRLVSPAISASYIQQPMLVIHGTKDIHIPFELGKRNFDCLACERKTFIPVEGADHNNVGAVGGQELMKRKLEFIIECVK